MSEIKSEVATRAGMIKAARKLGCEQELLQLFDKYDRLLRGCTNKQERDAISLMGVQEVHFLISSHPGLLEVNGKIVGKE